MGHYQLYHMNSVSGHIDWVVNIDATDDVAAVAEARRLREENAIELWQEGRKVLRLEARSRTPNQTRV